MKLPWVRRVHFDHLVKLLGIKRELIRAYQAELRKWHGEPRTIINVAPALMRQAEMDKAKCR